jgi:hypothetical protein
VLVEAIKNEKKEKERKGGKEKRRKEREEKRREGTKAPYFNQNIGPGSSFAECASFMY